jgi:hypothetical protein
MLQISLVIPHIDFEMDFTAAPEDVPIDRATASTAPVEEICPSRARSGELAHLSDEH